MAAVVRAAARRKILIRVASCAKLTVTPLIAVLNDQVSDPLNRNRERSS
jgi:hypothetical protein